MVDKNLFLYDLAVTAIFKDEAPYLKEWLNYHLLAGVEHFYLYNNDSTDDYKEVLAPYIERNLVTLTEFPGKMMQYPAYNDAIEKYRFECRYMAFIDIDEFIFPKSNRSIVEVIDEVLSKDPNAAGLAINWQIFGSNGHVKADYSRGVLERFTHRAPDNWTFLDEKFGKIGNHHVKTITNPRLIRFTYNPHNAMYFNDKFAVNSSGKCVPFWTNEEILTDKIVINHYFTKSEEEYSVKVNRGSAIHSHNIKKHFPFSIYDRNEVFDNGILKYRASRADNFSFESDEHRANRVVNALVKTLTQPFVDELETLLISRAVAEKFQIKIGDAFAEEIVLAKIYRTLLEANPLTYAEIQMFLKELPEILARPFPICKGIKQSVQDVLIPQLIDILKTNFTNWVEHYELDYIQKLLSLIK